MLEIYTDGAVKGNPGIGGWAFVVMDNSEEIYCEQGASGVTTNNIMEMTAMYYALRYCNANCLRCVIYTDSNYVYQTLMVWHHNWHQDAKGNWYKGKHDTIANLDLWLPLIDEFNKFQGTLKWVKGHADSRGNQRADALAVGARKEYEERVY